MPAGNLCAGYRIRGAYMKAEQMIMANRIIQSAIFGFND